MRKKMLKYFTAFMVYRFLRINQSLFSIRPAFHPGVVVLYYPSKLAKTVGKTMVFLKYFSIYLSVCL